MTRAYRWCFTINNYNTNLPDWLDILHDLELNKVIRYCVIGDEVGAQGTNHLQGYIAFNCRKYFTWMMGIFRHQAHIEPCKGTEAQNIDYCTKDHNIVYEYGTPQISRSNSKQIDHLQIYKDFKEMPFTLWKDKYPVAAIRYYNSYCFWLLNERLYNIVNYDGDLQDKNIWIWGPPGVGKSRWARQQSNHVYIKTLSKWWDGYDQKLFEVVLVEDYVMPETNNNAFLIQHMKIWSDRYQFQGEMKGSFMVISPAYYNLIITSNYSIDMCYPPSEAEAIKRRFLEVHIVDGNDINLQRKINLVNKLEN